MSYKIMGAAGITTLLVGTSFLSIRKRKRAIKTSHLLKAIRKRIAPSSNELTSQHAFDVHYLNKVTQSMVGQKVLVLKSSTAQYYAKEVYKTWKPWYGGGDDEEKLYGIFRGLSDKLQVSQVANAYRELYSQNLIDTFKERLSEAEIAQVLRIVNKLPNYRIAKV